MNRNGFESLGCKEPFPKEYGMLCDSPTLTEDHTEKATMDVTDTVMSSALGFNPFSSLITQLLVLLQASVCVNIRLHFTL